MEGAYFALTTEVRDVDQVNEEGALRQRPSYFNRIYVDPIDKEVVYVQNLTLFKSSNGGRDVSSHSRGSCRPPRSLDRAE